MYFVIINSEIIFISEKYEKEKNMPAAFVYWV